jgi:N-acetylmuramoyl-L-alanine amidase
MIDPAHGGSESGAVLNPTLLEKDVTLALARRLRQDLATRGIPGELVRDDDSTLSTDDRAARANREHPVLYICLHASSLVGSTRVVTAMLAEEEESHGTFLDWATAQSGPLRTSTAVQQQLVASFENHGLRARALAAQLRPLNNIAFPAVAVEVAPTAADVSQLIAPDFDETISSALANGIAHLVSSVAGATGASQP